MLADFFSRIGLFLANKARLKKLKHTPARSLALGHIDSLELLMYIKSVDDIKIIIDIGANEGTWTLLAKSIFPAAQVIAFEPLGFHIDLFNKNTKSLKDIAIFPLATGNFNGHSTINVSSFSDASSILKSTTILKDEFSISEIAETEIQVVRLDDFFLDKPLLKRVDLIKIDIQGYELEALKGATALLSTTKYVIMEVSFIEYYDQQPLFEEVIGFMFAHSFRTMAFGQNIQRGKKLTQADILFVNTNA